MKGCTDPALRGRRSRPIDDLAPEGTARFILIAGPYRSGTDDVPERMAENLRRLEEVAWPLFEAGHLPVIGEWVALPVWRAAGGGRPGDDLYDRIFHPAAERLLARVDAVLRLPGDSRGADDDVRRAEARGIPVYRRLQDVPGCAGTVERSAARAGG